MSNYGKQYFARAVLRILRDLGHDVYVIDPDEASRVRYEPSDVLFYIDIEAARRQSHLTGDRHGRKFVRPLCRTIYYNMDPVSFPGMGNAEQNYTHRFLRYRKRVLNLRMDAILDYNPQTTEAWRRDGQNAVHCPMGYAEEYEVDPDLRSFRIDGVMLLGKEYWDTRYQGVYDGVRQPPPDRQTRRGRICAAIRLAGTPCHVYDFRADTRSLERLNRTPGVHLNIHQIEPPFTFGPIRVVVFGLANRRFVLSERCAWHPGLRSGEHWVETDDIVAAAGDWYRRPEDCREIGEAGYAWVRKNHRLVDYLPDALRKVGVPC